MEDEFGLKLVAKSPLLSQVFIHGSAEESPRRSWLITQECKVDDPFWTRFTSEWKVENLFKTLEILEEDKSDGTQNLYLSFVGNAWHLDSSVESPTASQSLFRPHKPGSPAQYRGLMLDRHISNSVLGRVVDYFDNHEIMSQAVRKLDQHYRHDVGYSGGNDPDDSVSSLAINVALLGSSSAPNLPVVDYVGLVLAPCPTPKTVFIRTNQDDSTHAGQGSPGGSKTMTWKRISLMRWTEIYHDNNQTRHSRLSAPRNVECIII